MISALEQTVITRTVPSWRTIPKISKTRWTYHISINLMIWRKRRGIIKLMTLWNWNNWWLVRRRIMRWSTSWITIRSLITLILRCHRVISCWWWRSRVVWRSWWSRRGNILHCWQRRRGSWIWIVAGNLIRPIRWSGWSRWLPCWWRLVGGKWWVCGLKNCVVWKLTLEINILNVNYRETPL